MLSKRLLFLLHRRIAGRYPFSLDGHHRELCITTENTKSPDSLKPSASISESNQSNNSVSELWEDPWAHALGPPTPPPKFTKGVVESKEEFDWVRKLLPRKTIPNVPKHASYPTPSGWVPPKSPPPDLPYFIPRTRHHLFPLHLGSRRDDLNTKTLEYNYVEVILLKEIQGDIFACEEDLRSYLEAKLGHKVGTHVNELQGKITVKGADRSLLEQFLLEKGF